MYQCKECIYQRWNSFWNPDSCENVKEKVRPLEFHIGKLIDPKQPLLDNQYLLCLRSKRTDTGHTLASGTALPAARSLHQEHGDGPAEAGEGAHSH